VWFTEWAAESNRLMSQLVEETRRKNDLLEKLIDKLLISKHIFSFINYKLT